MHGDLYQFLLTTQFLLPDTEILVVEPVTGNIVPGLIHRGHNGIRFPCSPDKEPEPPLVREQGTGQSPPVVIRIKPLVLNRCFRLIHDRSPLAVRRATPRFLRGRLMLGQYRASEVLATGVDDPLLLGGHDLPILGAQRPELPQVPVPQARTGQLVAVEPRPVTLP